MCKVLENMLDADSINILLGGDFCPAGRIDTDTRRGTLLPSQVFESLRPLVDACDLSLVNLECPLTEVAIPIDKPCSVIRAHPDTIGLLKNIGIGVVALANNHIRDYDSKGVLDTLDACSASGIKTVGAGATLEAARQPLVIPIRGRKVVFVNVAEQEFANATATRAGANPLDLIELLHDLRQAKEWADHVILIVHGGLEMVTVPSPQSVRLLRFLSEQGVSAVLRHHAHVVQGYEVWKGVPIFYGLGNLLFDLASRMPDGWYRGLLVTLHLSPQGFCGFELHPIRQCDGSPLVQVLEGDAKAEALRRIAVSSALLASEEELSKAWAAALKPIREHYLGLLGVPIWPLRRILMRFGLLKYFHPSIPVTMCWENLLRCDTHREVLLDLLKQEKGSSLKARP